MISSLTFCLGGSILDSIVTMLPTPLLVKYDNTPVSLSIVRKRRVQGPGLVSLDICTVITWIRVWVFEWDATYYHMDFYRSMAAEYFHLWTKNSHLQSIFSNLHLEDRIGVPVIIIIIFIVHHGVWVHVSGNRFVNSKIGNHWMFRDLWTPFFFSSSFLFVKAISRR